MGVERGRPGGEGEAWERGGAQEQLVLPGSGMELRMALEASFQEN